MGDRKVSYLCNKEAAALRLQLWLFSVPAIVLHVNGSIG